MTSNSENENLEMTGEGLMRDYARKLIPFKTKKLNQPIQMYQPPLDNTQPNVIQYLAQYGVTRNKYNTHAFDTLVTQIIKDFNRRDILVAQFLDEESASKKPARSHSRSSPRSQPRSHSRSSPRSQPRSQPSYPINAMHYFTHNYLHDFWLVINTIVQNNSSISNVYRFKKYILLQIIHASPTLFIQYLKQNTYNDNAYILRIKNILHTQNIHIPLHDIVPSDEQTDTIADYMARLKFIPEEQGQHRIARAFIKYITDYAQKHNNLHPFFADFILFYLSKITHKNKIDIISTHKRVTMPCMRYQFQTGMHKYMFVKS